MIEEWNCPNYRLSHLPDCGDEVLKDDFQRDEIDVGSHAVLP